MKYFLGLAILFYCATVLTAQGIKGHVTDQNNEKLPHATVYVRSTETGTSTNFDGYYQISLPAGRYDVLYQYMGYESVLKVVQVQSGFTTLNISLKPQTIMLKDVVVKADKEDPAYTIMRKAIAKAKFHTNQLDAYKAQVYIKGSGRVKDVPFFLRKEMKKEGIDSTTSFTQESILEVQYTRPNKYVEKAIAIRTSGESNNTNPSEYVNASFYYPTIVDAISPLSPKAFAYYRFIYKGTFRDRDYEVSKIRVIPRSKGDDVFDGYINIVEDHWSIHSLDLSTTKFGINLKTKQIYQPIEQKVWLPINHKFDVTGTFLGVDFEYNYLATVSNYQITLNPDLDAPIEVIDDKVEKDLAKKLEEQNKNLKNKAIAEKLQAGEEMTRKDLRKLMREYEKQEQKKLENPKVIEEYKSIVDSTSYNSDSTYWAQARPVPLTDYEVKGYHKMDSMELEYQKEMQGDTTIIGRYRGFFLQDIIIGNSYKIGEKTHFKIKSMLPYIALFNTVEGFNMQYGVELTKTFANMHWISIEPTVRYSFARKKIVAEGKIRWKWSDNTNWTLQGGRQITQYNSQRAIHPILNTVTTLLYERNWMKLYQQDFISLRLDQSITDKFKIVTDITWTDRLQLYNNTTYKWVNKDGHSYTPNPPTNSSLSDTKFANHSALLTSLSVHYTPIKSYRIIDDKKYPVTDDLPKFSATLRNGHNVAGSNIKYSLLDVGINHKFDIGIRGKLTYKVHAGVFLDKSKLTFIDYQHFMGNRTIIQSTDPVKRYRLLDYYLHSTSDRYLSAMAYCDLRKLFLSRFRFFSKRGIKEALFINYLGTKASENYTEVGYGINNIFRLLRVEGVAAFQNGKYIDWGIRIGISTILSDMIDVEID